VIELAADVEATQMCIAEIIKHFLGHNNEKCHKSFKDTLYLFVCGISCAFYRFYSERPGDPEFFPSGSHPTPIRRLEVCISNIFEKLDLGGHGIQLHGFNRHQLIHLCLGASNTSGFFWLYSYAPDDGIPENFMPKSTLQDPYKDTYWNAIISAWDEIEPEIRKIRRFGTELGLLSFTDFTRSEL